MRLPLQVTFHNTSPSEKLRSAIDAEVEQLEDFYGGIISCRVMIDVPHRHHKEGNRYQVRVDLKVPDEEIAVSREPAGHTDDRDARRAIRESFDEVRRQLEDYVRRRRGYVKAHQPGDHARIARLFPDGNHGFLTTPDGREIYFHRNSVLHGGFDRLEVGSEVRFVEQQGDLGPRASTVEPIGRHGRL